MNYDGLKLILRYGRKYLILCCFIDSHFTCPGSINNEDYLVETPLLRYLCDEAANRGTECFFNALLKLGVIEEVLQVSDDCYQDFAITAREHGHENLAEKIVQLTR